MRSISLLVTACALSLATTNVVAVDEAQQSAVHLRIHAEGGAEIPNTAGVAAGTSTASTEEEDGAQEVPRQKHHQRANQPRVSAPGQCRKLKDEWFRDQIVSACGASNRKGVSNFFYLLQSGAIMRNCNCDDFLGGLIWKDEDGSERTPGYVSAAGLDFRCYSKEKPTTGWQGAIAPFNKDHIKCIPTDFTLTPF